jgi:hypothetical protein
MRGIFTTEDDRVSVPWVPNVMQIAMIDELIDFSCPQTILQAKFRRLSEVVNRIRKRIGQLQGTS